MSNLVTLLNPSNDQTESSKSGAGNAANTHISIGPFEDDALVFVTASGKSSYHQPGTAKNAGIILSILVDEALRAEADSFEALSSSIGFRCAAAFNFVVRATMRTPTVVRANITPSGVGENFDTSVCLQVFALAIKR